MKAEIRERIDTADMCMDCLEPLDRCVCDDDLYDEYGEES